MDIDCDTSPSDAQVTCLESRTDASLEDRNNIDHESGSGDSSQNVVNIDHESESGDSSQNETNISHESGPGDSLKNVVNIGHESLPGDSSQNESDIGHESRPADSSQNDTNIRDDRISCNEQTQDRLSPVTVTYNCDPDNSLSSQLANAPRESTSNRSYSNNVDTSLSAPLSSDLAESISASCQNESPSQLSTDKSGIDKNKTDENMSSVVINNNCISSSSSQNLSHVENGDNSENTGNSLVRSVEEIGKSCDIEESNESLDKSQTSLKKAAIESNEQMVVEAGEESISKNNAETQNESETSPDGPQISMVTTLTDEANQSFVEPPRCPDSPVLSNATNPLETDGDEVYATDKNTDCVSDPDVSLQSVPEAEKDSDEVITADKALISAYGKKNSSGDNISSPNLSYNHAHSKEKGGPNFQVKVIYPSSKVGDAGKFPVTRLAKAVLRSCFQCKKISQCLIQMQIGENTDGYLCSDECLQKHKAQELNIQLPAPTANIPDEKRDFGPDSRICLNCDANVSILPQDKVLSWETMEFCNEECLGKYMSKMWCFCSACKKDVPTSSMGKYCVRFGHEVKQFCAGTCLEEYKKGIKVCSYCQKDLSDGEGFLAPIGEKGQFRDFCTQRCLEEYECMSRNIPSGGIKIEPCDVCNKKQIVQIQVVTSNNNVNLCSEVCFAAFKFVNTTISCAPCYMCKKFYDKTLATCVTIFYDNELLSFCSKACMNVSILSKRKIVNCHWCKVKKYNFDMIKKKPKGTDSQFYCSVNCMTLFKVSAKAATSHKSIMSCTQCKKMDFPNLHLTMSDATVRNFCSMDCVTKYQGTFGTGVPTNGVVPTGPPKRISRNRVPNSEGNATTPDNVPTVASGCQNLPKVQMKKPGDLQGINHVPNGPSGAMSPQSFPNPVVKYQTIFMPPVVPEMRNFQVQISPNMLTKAVSTNVTSYITEGVQTDESVVNDITQCAQTEDTDAIGKEVTEGNQKIKGPIMIPVPVPIYIPCPMAMYSVPAPTPFPLPIPIVVPIFIPTTKGTAEEIFADIKRIQEETPGNPYEAELIFMAELEEQKSKTDSDGPSSPGSDNRKGGQKRPCSGGDDMDSSDTGGPPEKRPREESSRVDETFERVVVQQMAASALPMSLKETLGVSAWRHYAADVGEKKNLIEMSPGDLAQALKGFIISAKIPGKGDYTPDQKYYLMLGIQYYLEESGRIDNIFFDSLFDPFIDSLNLEAERFIAKFDGCDKVVTRVEEEHLWESKQLGPHSPYSLLQTLIYFNTKYFNLTTVDEHMQLSFNQIVKQWKRNPNAPPGSQPSSNGARNVILRFYPPQSILDGNPKKKRMYEQNANDEDPYKCPVYLYEFYMSKCPESVKSRTDMFYMSPERSCVPDSPIWYSTLPLPEKIIERTLNRFKMVKEINLAMHSPV